MSTRVFASPRQDVDTTRGPSKETGFHQINTRKKGRDSAPNEHIYKLSMSRIKNKAKKAIEKIRATRFNNIRNKQTTNNSPKEGWDFKYLKDNRTYHLNRHPEL